MVQELIEKVTVTNPENVEIKDEVRKFIGIEAGDSWMMSMTDFFFD